MSLMLRLLSMVSIATLSCSLSYGVDKNKIEAYLKNHVVKNPQVKLKGVEIIESQKIPTHSGWEAVFAVMSLEFQGRTIQMPETVFLQGDLATSQLFDLKTNTDFKSTLRPSVPESVYSKDHLLFGNENAKHKIIVFSDPMCPFCRDVVPQLMKSAKENPDKIALYYYHLPLLQIHPVSGPLTRIMHLAQKDGRVDVVEKIYTINLPFKETNLTKIIQEVHKHTGYSASESHINDPKTVQALKHDEKIAARLMVRGTPTIFVDGKLDKTRQKYKELIK